MDSETRGGRDELNLAEFPLAVIGKRPVIGVKTLVFCDQTWDCSQGAYVTRRLTVTGSDLLGLPTQFDDEVLLACVQLSRADGFQRQELRFSRYDLLRLLGKRPDGKNYQRLSESLCRWVGTLVISEKAWWDKRAKCWVQDSFNVIDRVKLLEKRPEGEAARESRPSSLVWGDFMWRSFQAGNLKELDFEFWKGLRWATSKRLYRLLDKRFWHAPVATFDMHTLAHEKVGLSRRMHTGQIKEKLWSAIQELVTKGFLADVPKEAVFLKDGAGTYRAKFRRAARSGNRWPEKMRPGQADGLEGNLSKRGVTAKVATSLARTYDEHRVREKVELFDWLTARGEKVGGGWLRRAIEDDYRPPDGFQSEAERNAEREVGKRLTRNRSLVERRREVRQQRERQESQRLVSQYLDSLSGAERQAIIEAAWAEASSLERKHRGDGPDEPKSPIADAFRQRVVERYVLKMLA